MKLVFTLFKYFPFGGLQRDCLAIARESLRRGDEVEILTLEWQGKRPDGLQVTVLESRAWQNHTRYRQFHHAVRDHLQGRACGGLVGFNKMPGLDIYYAADPCFLHKARQQRSWLYRLGPRYRHFHAFEAAVFSPGVDTRILTISDQERAHYQACYNTPDHRFHPLPPGVSRTPCAEEEARRIRQQFRDEMGLSDGEMLLLLVGSGFKTKGLDRLLHAMNALPEGLRASTRLYVVGQDNPAPFLRLAARYGLREQIRFWGGRDDVPRFMLGADCMVHPAYSETAGIVILEAMVAGLPVMASGACGHARYIAEAGAGVVLDEPFEQGAMNRALVEMLTSAERRQQWRESGLAFAAGADLYRQTERAVDTIETLLGASKK